MTNAPITPRPRTSDTQLHDTYEHRNCAALKWNATAKRWEGNLHFRRGTLAVYLEVNPSFGYAGQPALRIRQVSDNANIGCLFRNPDGTFYGRLDTEKPYPLFGMENKDAGRFVIKKRHGVHLVQNTRRRFVVLNLTPYPKGEQYHGK